MKKKILELQKIYIIAKKRLKVINMSFYIKKLIQAKLEL